MLFSLRVALHDDCPPWLTFLVQVKSSKILGRIVHCCLTHPQITFEDSRAYTDHDRGLLTFLRRSNGEDWRFEEVGVIDEG